MDNHQHGCPVLLIGCMDWRMHPTAHKYLTNHYGTFDVVHLAGAGRTLITPQTVAIVLEQIRISLQLHHIKTVVLVNHEDCGAYGGSAAFAHDPERELAQHRADLQQATTVIKDAFPQLTVVKLWQHKDNGPIEIIK